jgi:hypothetical protein
MPAFASRCRTTATASRRVGFASRRRWTSERPIRHDLSKRVWLRLHRGLDELDILQRPLAVGDAQAGYHRSLATTRASVSVLSDPLAPARCATSSQPALAA